jgi:exopolysaccharide production protein ExoZ
MQSVRQNLESVQFLRFIAAGMVVIFHATQAVNKYFPDSVPKSFGHGTALGPAGVHIFFVISGFIMMYGSLSIERLSAKEFLLRRFSRIYPIYLLYAALYIAFYDLLGPGKRMSPQEFLGSLALLPGYSSYIIGPGWSLGYEVYFYACFAAMVLLLRRGLLPMSAFFVGSVCLGLILRKAGSATWEVAHPVLAVLTNSLLVEFLFGAWIAHFLQTKMRIGIIARHAMLLVALLAFFFGTMIGYDRFPSIVMWGIPSALLICSLVFGEVEGRLPAIVRTYGFLGNSSYSLYLLHIVVVDAVLLALVSAHFPSYLVSQPIGAITLSLFLAALCIGLSVVAYEMVERKLLYFVRNVLTTWAPPIQKTRIPQVLESCDSRQGTDKL